jgi:hypothetical protein
MTEKRIKIVSPANCGTETIPQKAGHFAGLEIDSVRRCDYLAFCVVVSAPRADIKINKLYLIS